MSTDLLMSACLKELEAEAVSTRKCLERISADKFEFKPHPSSMSMVYLSLLVAEIPRWIAIMIKEGEIDFASFTHPEIKATAELVKYFDENMKNAVEALKSVPPADHEKMFSLKREGKVIFSVKMMDYIGPTINHWVHHRGQLTVYMRISEIPVPSIYGPSGDDKNF